MGIFNRFFESVLGASPVLQTIAAIITIGSFTYLIWRWWVPRVRAFWAEISQAVAEADAEASPKPNKWDGLPSGIYILLLMSLGSFALLGWIEGNQEGIRAVCALECTPIDERQIELCRLEGRRQAVTLGRGRQDYAYREGQRYFQLCIEENGLQTEPCLGKDPGCYTFTYFED